MSPLTLIGSPERCVAAFDRSYRSLTASDRTDGLTMRALRIVLGLVLSLMAMTAYATGVQFLEIPSSGPARPLTGAIWYPCNALGREIVVRDVTLQGVKDCPLDGDEFPLVVMSHGRGGWFGIHHALAASIADAGFVVAAVDHPDHNSQDRARIDAFSTLVERPADVKRLIDFMYRNWTDAAKLDQNRVGIFGFSLGGYTALVAIGGDPDFRRDLPACEKSHFLACEQLRNGEAPSRAVSFDERIRAAIVVDPGPSMFFPSDRLRSIKVPIQLWSSDPKLSANFISGCCALGLRSRLPMVPEFHLVSNGIHFSFLPPCSEAMRADLPARLCDDAPGFDRSAFHHDFNNKVIGFLRRHLTKP
jgi:predicted dienelactone hydrolase